MFILAFSAYFPKYLPDPTLDLQNEY